MAHLHGLGVLHSDLKPENVLYDGSNARVSDLGTATPVVPLVGCGAEYLCTITYRAPENMLGGAVTLSGDLWAAGVTFARMITGTIPFYNAHCLSEYGMLIEIFKALGTPTAATWPGHAALRNWSAFPNFVSTPDSVSAALGIPRGDALDVVLGFLRFDPSKRTTFEEALWTPLLAPSAQAPCTASPVSRKRPAPEVIQLS